MACFATDWMAVKPDFSGLLRMTVHKAGGSHPPRPVARPKAAPWALPLAVLDPLVVQRLRALVHHQLQARRLVLVPPRDLQQPGATPPSRSHGKTGKCCLELLLAHNLPGTNAGQDQATLHRSPEHSASLCSSSPPLPSPWPW